MKITLPIIWPVVGTLRRQKTQKLHHVHQLIEVEIKEVDPMNAPICISCEQMDVRYYDDSFWYPVNEFSHCQNPPKDSYRHDEVLKKIQNLSPQDVDEESFDFPVVERAFDTSRFATWDHRYFKEKDFSEIEESNPETDLNEVMDLVNDTILLDGFLWRRAGEPAIQIAIWNKTNNDTPFIELLPVDAVSRGMDRDHQKRLLFNIGTEAEDIVASAAELLAIDPEEFPEIPELDVLMPELIENTVTQKSFGQIVTKGAAKWWRAETSSFRSTSLRTLELLTELKRGSEHLNEYPSMENAEELNAVVRQILNEIRLPEEPREQFLLATAYLESALQNMDLKIDGAFGVKP